MESVLRPLIVIGGSVVITLLVGWLVDLLLRRADSRHHETPLWGLLRRCRPPLQVVLITALLRSSYRQMGVDWIRDHRAGIGQVLTLVLIGASAWLVVRIAATVVEASYARYATASRDPARVRRVRTQVTLIQRVVIAVVTVVAIAAMLLTFPPMRAVGTSMLASAGLLGIVAGVAAQSTLGNLFAGFQIAFGDMVRLGDTVVVDGEWGTIDEITLTFLAVRTWDDRRITMPVSYFTSQPFENWSRGGVQMTGTVYFHLDHSAPIAAMRKKLRELPRGHRRLGRPGLVAGGHRHHADHDRGARGGHGEGRRRHLDSALRGARAADRLAARPPSVRTPAGGHRARRAAAGRAVGGADRRRAPDVPREDRGGRRGGLPGPAHGPRLRSAPTPQRSERKSRYRSTRSTTSGSEPGSLRAESTSWRAADIISRWTRLTALKRSARWA
ncbi:hypothetical protein SGRI78S_00808 [Streptomyces griseus subsp. griseus]